MPYTFDDKDAEEFLARRSTEDTEIFDKVLRDVSDELYTPCQDRMTCDSCVLVNIARRHQKNGSLNWFEILPVMCDRPKKWDT